MLLPDQDRSRWDRALIAEGQAIVRRCLRRRPCPGPYQIQAAINAVHSDAASAAATDWRQIVALYDQLLALAPTPVVALNRAVAVAEVDGAGRRRSTIVDDLDLDDVPPVPRQRGPTCCARLGDDVAAVRAYDRALVLAANTAERNLLKRKRDALPT